MQPYPRQNRRFVCGLRESCKALKAGKVKAVLLAPDIQLNRSDRPELRSEVLDNRVNDILKGCCKPGQPGVPVVFALSRKQIGQVGAVAVLWCAVLFIVVTSQGIFSCPARMCATALCW